jgi:hypothetical protein
MTRLIEMIIQNPVFGIFCIIYCLQGYPVILMDDIQDLRALLRPEKLQHN